MFRPSGPCLCTASASHLSRCGDRRLPPRGRASMPSRQQKTDADEHAEVFDHIGLLVNDRPPLRAVLHFVIRRLRVKPRATPAHPLRAHSSDAHGNTRPREIKRDRACRPDPPANRASGERRGTLSGVFPPSFAAAFTTHHMKPQETEDGTCTRQRRSRIRSANTFPRLAQAPHGSSMRGVTIPPPTPTLHKTPPAPARNHTPGSGWRSGRGGCSRSACSEGSLRSAPVPAPPAPARETP